MNKTELLKNIIRSFHEMLLSEVLPRDFSLPVDTRKIICVCGVRRCGKTSALLDTINRLIENGISKEIFRYLNIL